MRGLVFWLVVALTIGTGSWLYNKQEWREKLLPEGAKLLAVGEFTLPVGGEVKVYTLPDGQARVIFERLRLDKNTTLTAMLSSTPDADDPTAGAVVLGEVKHQRIQALDIPRTARKVNGIILVRSDQNVVWAKTTLERAY